LNLGTVVIGAFYDDEVRKVLKMSDREQPLYMMPVGRLK
jgi:nitroreductase